MGSSSNQSRLYLREDDAQHILVRTIVKGLIFAYSNNCHSHVARALNKYNYNGRSNYTMIDVWLMTVLKSKYVR